MTAADVLTAVLGAFLWTPRQARVLALGVVLLGVVLLTERPCPPRRL